MQSTKASVDSLKYPREAEQIDQKKSECQLSSRTSMAFIRFQTPRLSAMSLSCAVVCVLLCFSHSSHAPAVNLQRFIGCAVREFTFLAQKPGCGRLQINTDACWGRCETWEKPILDPPFIESRQRVCTYNQTRFMTVQLPNCSAGVDPYYTYPVALRCECGVCVTSTTECITSV